MIRAPFLAPDDRAALLRRVRSQTETHGVARRANALLLLDEGLTFEAVCRHLYLDDGTVREWHRRYQRGGIAAALAVEFRGGAPAALEVAQQEQLKAWLSQRFCRSSAQIGAWIQAQFGVVYSRSGLGKLLGRLGFDYRKPTPVPAIGDEAAQRRFIADYEACLNQQGPADRVYFVDAVHPEYQSRPAFGWGVRGEPVAVRQTPGRQRMNLHGALCLEDFSLVLVESLRIDAASTLTVLQRLQSRHPGHGLIHVFLDNARYHHARALRDFLDSADCRIRLHFLPAYCPHLNPIERLWGEMHRHVTHNTYYETFASFVASVDEFFHVTVPKTWRVMRDRVSDAFRIITHQKFRILSG